MRCMLRSRGCVQLCRRTSRFVVWSAGGRAGEQGATNAAGEKEAVLAEEAEAAEEAAHGQRRAKGKRPDEAKSSRKRDRKQASAHDDAGWMRI